MFRFSHVLISQSGAALVFTIIVMVVVVLLGGAILTMAQTEMQLGHLDYRQRGAFHAAQAGIEYAHSWLDKNEGDFEGLKHQNPDPFDDRSFSLAVDADERKIQSTGEFRGAQKTIVAEFVTVTNGWPQWDEGVSFLVGDTRGEEERDNIPELELYGDPPPFSLDIFDYDFWTAFAHRPLSEGEAEDGFDLDDYEEDLVVVSDNGDPVDQMKMTGNKQISGSGVVVIYGNADLRGNVAAGEGDSLLFVVLGNLDVGGNADLGAYFLVSEYFGADGIPSLEIEVPEEPGNPSEYWGETYPLSNGNGVELRNWYLAN